MRIHTAFIALAVLAAPLAVVAPARAANVSVGVDIGGIAFGFSDGYWDQNHQWHPWRNHQQFTEFKRQQPNHYFGHKHTQEKNMGWHDEDRYWEHPGPGHPGPEHP
ncbi:MAG: hypothetical protein ACREEL_12990 [Stellaceae bacterium]